MATQGEYTRSNKRVIGYCLIVGLAAMGFGLGSGETSGFLAMPVFNEVYGEEYDPITGRRVLSAAQQTTLNGSTLGAAAVTAAISGYIGTRFGRHRGLFFVTIFSFLTGIVQIATTTWAGLLAGRIIGGLAVGFAANFVIPYWAETTPASLRGMIIVLYQGIVNVSQFVGQCVNEGSHNLKTRWAYRAPLMTEFIPSLLLLVGLYFLPETPRWYAARGLPEKALESMRRIRGPTYPEEEIRAEVADIIAMVEIERELEGASTWADCFRGTDLRRTTLTVVSTVYGTFFFQLSGVTHAFLITVITGVCGIAGSISAFFLVRWFGRRPILIVGAASQGTCMFIFAIVAVALPGSTAASKCLCAFVSIFIFTYGATWGAVSQVLLGEIPSNKLRSKTIGLATCAGWLCDTLIICGIPYLLSPVYANMGAKVGFIFGGTQVVVLLWSIFFIPETKDRTLEEIDEMFMNGRLNSIRVFILLTLEQGTPAWKFKSYVITRTVQGHSMQAEIERLQEKESKSTVETIEEAA
ncbi:hypothetical protein CLAIMM_02638 [Cladophialophora immunda]|nr:hypothetical protein CLAIMM_02638 [Cladophialophora immunda]